MSADFTEISLKNLNSSNIGAILEISNQNFNTIKSYINELLDDFTYEETANKITLATVQASNILGTENIKLNSGSNTVFSVDSNGVLEANKSIETALFKGDRIILNVKPDSINTVGVTGEIVWDGLDFYGFTNDGWTSLTKGGGSTSPGSSGEIYYQRIRVYNDTGSVLSENKVVKLSGFNDSTITPNVALISDYSDVVFGVVETDIADGDTGTVMIKGAYVDSGVNTGAATIGDKVYSDDSGNLTLTETVLPLAVVLSLEADGTIYIDVPALGGGSTPEGDIQEEETLTAGVSTDINLGLASELRVVNIVFGAERTSSDEIGGTVSVVNIGDSSAVTDGGYIAGDGFTFGLTFQAAISAGNLILRCVNSTAEDITFNYKKVEITK